MFTGDSLPPSLLMLMHAPCSSCRTNHCRGCFRPVTCSISCKGPARNKNCNITTCCAEGRAIAIFETLGGFDRQYINERARSDSRTLALAKNKSAAKSTVGPGGTGYGTGRQSGSYGQGLVPVVQPTKASKTEKLAARRDEVVVRAFQTLTELLPSPYADSPQAYDLVPHASIGPLLSLSKLTDLLGSLLRNDSVTEWIARSEIYHAMISLLRRMADCELTVHVLVGRRYVMTEGPGLESWIWGEGDIAWEKAQSGVLERAPPLYQHFKKLARQCEAFQTGALQMANSGSSLDDANDLEEAMMQATSLCGDIIAAKGDMERVMAVLCINSSDEPTPSLQLPSTHKARPSAKGKEKGESTGRGKKQDISISLDIDKAYIAACEELAFKHVMLAVTEDSKGKGKGLEYSLYNYARELDQTQSATRAQNYRFHLVKELAVMATSLPPGVWVRADEVRNDAMCEGLFSRCIVV
jgi:hypothetical protein